MNNPAKMTRKEFEAFYRKMFQDLNSNPIEEENLDTVDGVKNYLLESFLGVELKLNSNPAEDQVKAHEAVNVGLKRIRSHVKKGTYVPEYAKSTFMPQMSGMLTAYNEALVRCDMDVSIEEPLEWFEVLNLPDRYELTEKLFNDLQGFIHNYRSTSLSSKS